MSRSGGGCTAQDLAPAGFTAAEIRDTDGALVAADLFDRQGGPGCLAPDQAGPESAGCPHRATP